MVKLQQSSDPEPEIWLEYSGKVVPTDENNIAKTIGAATDDIVGMLCISFYVYLFLIGDISMFCSKPAREFIEIATFNMKHI